MKVNTVSDLLEMSEGTVPEAFRGKIKSVFRPSTGEGKNGQYHMQKMLVTDGQSTIEVMFDGRAEVSRQMEGSEVYCIASRGNRGLSGLKRKENNYKGKITQQVWVYDSADVSFNGEPQGQAQQGGNDQAHEPNPQDQSTYRAPPPRQQNNGGNQQRQQAPQGNSNQRPPQQSNQPQQQRSAPTPPKTGPEATAAAMKEFEGRLGRNVAALSRCFDAAMKLVNDVNERYNDTGGFAPSHDGIKELAVCLFIQTSWVVKPGEDKAFPLEAFQIVKEKLKAQQQQN